MTKTEQLEWIARWIIQLHGTENITALAEELEGTAAAFRLFREPRYSPSTCNVEIGLLLTSQPERLAESLKAINAKGHVFFPYYIEFPTDLSKTWYCLPVSLCETDIWHAAETLEDLDPENLP